MTLYFQLIHIFPPKICQIRSSCAVHLHGLLLQTYNNFFFNISVHSHGLMYGSTATTFLANFLDDTTPTQSPSQNSQTVLFFTVSLYEYFGTLTHL